MKKLIIIFVICCFISGCSKEGKYVNTGNVLLDESLLSDNVKVEENNEKVK